MNRKRLIALFLAAMMCVSLLAGCGGGTTTTETPATEAPATEAPATEAPAPEPEPEAPATVALDVVTTYSGNDGNGTKFRDYVKQWEAETGNTVNDASATSDETFKTRVLADFQTGTEPDVLFFFNGVDANPIVESGKVVSIDEIRAEYPDYASNMVDGLLGASPVDGKNYSVPVNGYWEGMFVNLSVLEAAGVALPGPDYTWDQFLTDCDAIKAAGYTPIAASLAQIPHYWFEFTIYNYLGPTYHNILPENDENNQQFQAWVNGLNDMKDLYERGYFPANTLTALDDDTFQMFIDGKAAFLIDGSWKIGGIENRFKENDEDTMDTMSEDALAAYIEGLEGFDVTFVPGKEERVASDAIGGLSMGYYITRKAWDDPAKREAAVSFIQYMTTDAVVSDFASVSATALKNGSQVDESTLSPLALKGLKFTTQFTGMAGAVQDQVPADARVPIFDGMPMIVTGAVDPADAIKECLELIG